MRWRRRWSARRRRAGDRAVWFGDGLARGLAAAHRSRTRWRGAHADDQAIDVGYAGDRIFLNIAGIGFDAAVGQLFATRTTRGAFGYVGKSLSLVWIIRAPTQYDVAHRRRRRDHQGTEVPVAFANAPEYGNGAVLAPDADVRDGLVDVVLVEAGTSAAADLARATPVLEAVAPPARRSAPARTRTARTPSRQTDRVSRGR